MTFAALSFTSPWILLGLAALPAIYYLLRFVPPRPETISFPPTKLLMGLVPDQRTPSQSPWWLTLLRMVVAACIILALSGPLLNPQAQVQGSGSGPILAVLDDGWAAASRWQRRQQALDDIVARAEDTEVPLYLTTTARRDAALRPTPPAEVRRLVSTLEPSPHTPDRAALAQRIRDSNLKQQSPWQVYWLTDGVEDEGAQPLREALAELASGGGSVRTITDEPARGALALFSPASSGSADITAVVKRAGSGVPRTGDIIALTAKGEQLARVSFSLGANETEASVTLPLPLELRNQVARIEIDSEDSAGAVYLLDSTSQRKKVGLIASESSEEAQPLLSPALYVQKALAPFTEVIDADTGNLDAATGRLLEQSPSIIMLSDVGRLVGQSYSRLEDWVKRGGTLVRFAGPRLEQGGDDLLPAPLRDGGRTLGGALTWADPQKPAAFEPSSPFSGLTIPADVTIKRQVLTDPSRFLPDAQVWARLEDGTPLVTARKVGSGLAVLFHVTANADWSTLPMSGLFVEMLRKMVEISPAILQPAANADAAASSSAPASAGAGAGVEAQPVARTGGALQAWRVLDGFGRLSQPRGNEQAVQSGELATLRPSAATPPGYYGPQLDLRALNVVADDQEMKPLMPPANALMAAYAPAHITKLGPWLFLAAFLLFVADSVVSALMFGSRAARTRLAGASAAILVAVMVAAPYPGVAQNAPPKPEDEAMRFALAASLETRLAYVVTGDTETDKVSHSGLSGLSRVLAARTAVEPGEPIGVDPARDELAFFPLIYWPVLRDAEGLPDAVLARVDAYMKQGGMIIFDTRESQSPGFGLTARGTIDTPLSRLLGKLDIPPLQKIPDDHVLTKAFYLVQSFPGRWNAGDLWVEARSESVQSGERRPVKADGVSSIIVTSNDFAGAWALNDVDRPMFACVPGGEDQREMSFRSGVNLVMYALTGNYKADQVHVPALLERLGH